MFAWLKRAERAAGFAVTSAAARDRWNWCFAKAAGRAGARHYDIIFWEEVADAFSAKWREIEPASKDPERMLERRLGVYLAFLRDSVLKEGECGNLTIAQLEAAGVFVARASVLDLRDAIMSSPEEVSPIFNLLPRSWLETAGVTHEQFDHCYFQRTGRNRDIQRLKDAVGGEAANKIVKHMSGLTEEQQSGFVRDFKEHMQESIARTPSAPPPVPSRPVELPSEGLYIHLNGEAKGPFTQAQLEALLAVKTIHPETPCCHEGSDAWQTVSAYVEGSG